MKPSCLIVDLMHPSIVPMLEEAGFQVSYQPDMKPEEVSMALKGFQALIVRSKLHISAEVISEATDLKVVARAGAGLDNIDVEALKERSIRLVSAPEGNRDAVGEFTIGLLLTMFRNIAKADQEVKQLKWLREENRGEELFGKTVGIIGYGNMGKAFARCLSGFNCNVLAYDTAGSRVYDQMALKASLKDIYEKAEVVSLHIPYTPKNYHFANEVFFESFQNPVWVLNTARGEVMDYSALVKALQNGRIKGAALDVLENEKLNRLSESQQLNFDYLAAADNVVLTPHIAGWSHQSYLKINYILVQKLKAVVFQNDALL